MAASYHPAAGLWLRLGLGQGGAAPAGLRPASGMRLFHVVTIRGDLVLGLTPTELAGFGPGPDVERLARRIAEEGQVSGWLYGTGRDRDGALFLRAERRVSVLRQDALTLQPHRSSLPILVPRQV